MKRLVMALALACVLSCQTLADNIPTSGAPSPPPPSNSTALAGEIPSSDSTFAGNIQTSDLVVLLTILGLAF
jgi:hypothetical protein